MSRVRWLIGLGALTSELNNEYYCFTLKDNVVDPILELIVAIQ